MRGLRILSGATVALITVVSIAPSVSINIGHMLNQGGTLPLLTLAVVSVVAAPACLMAMPRLYEYRRFDLIAGALVLFILSLAFNLSNAIGLVGANRDATSEDRVARMAKIKRAEERRSQLNARLADYRRIAMDETAAMVEAELLKLRADPVFTRSAECRDVTLPDSKAHCAKIADTLRRKGAAEQMASLSSELRDVTASLNAWGAAPLTADPKTDRVARFLSLLVPITHDGTAWVGYGLDAITALLVEALAAFLPAIAFAALWPRGGVTHLAGKSTRFPESLPAKPSPILGDTQNGGAPNMAPPEGPAAGPEPLPENPPFPEKPNVVKPIGNQAMSGKAVSGKSQKTRTRGQRKGRQKGQHIPESVRTFAGRCILRRSGAEIQATGLFQAYADDCRSAGIDPVSQKAFGLALAELGYRKRTGRLVVYEGIALRHIRPSLAVVNG